MFTENDIVYLEYCGFDEDEKCPECGCVESGCWEVGCMSEDWEAEDG